MKITLSIPSLTHAGAERVVSLLANEFVKMGHETEILLFYDREIWYSLDERVKVTVSEKEIKNKNILSQMLWRRKYIKSSKPDVIFSFLAPFNMLNIVNFFGLKTKLIVADRNDPRKVPTNKLIRFARNFLYQFANGCVFQSKNNKNYFGKVVRKKSAVIFNPVVLEDYEGIALKIAKSKKIVSVGRLIAQKNPFMLLSAFGSISEEFPEHRLVFYGDGDMMDLIKQTAREMGLEGRVELAGAKKNVFEYTKDADVYVMTSYYEGMPNALIEAMCMGLPVISTKVSGASDVIKSGENGILVDIDDVDALADALRKVLNDKEFANSCGENASHLAEELRPRAIAEKWLEFYKRL